MPDQKAEQVGMPSGTRVPGHSIVANGAPHDDEGRNMNRDHRWPNDVGGAGRCLCSCGEDSEWLPSAYQRRKWHRAHRAEVWARG